MRTKPKCRRDNDFRGHGALIRYASVTRRSYRIDGVVGHVDRLGPPERCNLTALIRSASEWGQTAIDYAALIFRARDATDVWSGTYSWTRQESG
jgi:hypothetical protein